MGVRQKVIQDTNEQINVNGTSRSTRKDKTHAHSVTVLQLTDYDLFGGWEDVAVHVIVGAQDSQEEETLRDYKESIICFITVSPHHL